MKNEEYEEEKNAILTRVQGSNNWKGKNFSKKLPSYIESAINELDALCK